jgi:hypothetical protein
MLYIQLSCKQMYEMDTGIVISVAALCLLQSVLERGLFLSQKFGN